MQTAQFLAIGSYVVQQQYRDLHKTSESFSENLYAIENVFFPIRLIY